MLRYAVVAALLVAGVIHLLPVTGVVGGARLTALYGVDMSDPNLTILMRHRAVLFGLLGAFLLAAAFTPRWQIAAFATGVISTASFLLLAWLAGDYNAQIGRVVTADLVALVSLLAGLAARAVAAGR